MARTLLFWTAGPDERTETLPAITKELIGSGIAVLVTAGTPATVAAKRASASLPIVLVAVDDPVSLGIVESLGNPAATPRTMFDLVRSDYRTVGTPEGARPWSASAR